MAWNINYINTVHCGIDVFRLLSIEYLKQTFLLFILRNAIPSTTVNEM